MVQPNSQYGNSVYFPYAAGCLTAYAFNDETVREHYLFKDFIYKKTDIDATAAEMENPFLVGFSCYVWNFEYNKAFAKKIKELYPSCLIVFGGHQINDRSEIIGAEYVDYVMLGEGEEAFRKLLKYLCGCDDINTIPNLIYKSNGKTVRTAAECTQIPERVSPYLEGYFDNLVEREKLEFSAILESNRGCPNKCAFCDWGNIKSRVKMYDLDMVKAEIDWMSEHRIEYCYCADANFGLFPRDMDIVDYVIKKHSENGYPQKFQATYSKNNAETVFEINKKLNEAGVCKGATLSFQSMHQDVLNNIYRKNMPIESFHKLMSLYNQSGIPAYSEIILGLPGETYETFTDGIEQLLECGQHMAINYFNCELLKNSIMSDPEYIKKYDIRSAKTEQHQYHILPSKQGIREYSDIVISTSSMSTEMWMESNIFGVFVRAFHNLGLLQCIAIYLYYEKGIKYKTFYNNIIEQSKKNKDSICGKIYYWLIDKYTEILGNSGSLTCIVPEFGELIWPLDEGTFLKAIIDYDGFYNEIKSVISEYFDDEFLFEELFEYQKSIVKTPYTRVKTLDLSFDFYTYFTDVYNNEYKPLVKKDNTLKIDMTDIPTEPAEYAAKTIWYGRKGGQNITTNITRIDG